ncbi:MAG: hypothetical protein N2Z22_02100 [Turneriella sp.]|nr:hypothetical protein [Turneriella sp.]
MLKAIRVVAVLASLIAAHCALQNGSEEIIGSRKAENVRDLTPVDARYIVNTNTPTLYFSNSSPLVKEVKKGDIVVSDVNPSAPAGYLRKVTDVIETPETKILETVPAGITEAVEEGQSRAEGILNPAGDNRLLTGATYNPLNGRIETITPQPGVTVYGTQQPVHAIPECRSKRWYVEFNNVNIQNAGTINGCVGLDIRFVLEVKIKWFELKSAEFSINPSVAAKFSTNLSGATFQISRAQVTLTTFHLQPITFFIASVPVVVIPRIAIVLGVDGKVTASLATSVQFAASAKAGLVYANKAWNLIRERNSTYNIVPPTISGSIDAMVYAGPEATFLLYGVAGPGANLYVYSHFKADWNAATNQLQRWQIWLGFEAGAHFTVEAFGRTLFRISEPAILGYEGLVASSDFGGIAPPGTGRITGVIGQAISGHYQRQDGSFAQMSGDLVTVGKLVGTLANR